MTSTAPELETEFYTISDLRKLLKLGRDQVYQLVTTEMRHLRIGVQYRVPKREFDAWLERRLSQSQTAVVITPFVPSAPAGRKKGGKA